MKPKSFLPLLLLFAAFSALLLPHPARAGDDEVSAEYFDDSLSQYGEWVEVGDYGTCWRPTNVDPDWAPYTDGYWAYTDAGWTWVSYEDFGGIVYHYGRWLRVDGEGWCWKPDYEWAPAWVSWRADNDYVGWAPLPPEAHWQPDVGFSTWVDSTCDIGPGYYNFCHIKDFGAPVLRGVILSRDRNFGLMRDTRNITNTSVTTFGDRRVIFNGGPNFAAMNRVVGHPIPALKLVQNTHIDAGAIRGGGVGKIIGSRTVGNQLIVAAPMVAAPRDPGFLKSKSKREISIEKVTKGWSGVKDPGARQELRQQIQAQTKGAKPETMHARPIAAEELKGIPSHGNADAKVVEEGKGHRNDGQGPGGVTKPFIPPGEKNVGVPPGDPRKNGGNPPGFDKNAEEQARQRSEKEKGNEAAVNERKNVEAQHQAQIETQQKGNSQQKEKEAMINERKNVEAQHQAQIEAQQKGNSQQKEKEAMINERKNVEAQHQAQIEAQQKGNSQQKEKEAMVNERKNVEAQHQAQIEAQQKGNSQQKEKEAMINERKNVEAQHQAQIEAGKAQAAQAQHPPQAQRPPHEEHHDSPPAGNNKKPGPPSEKDKGKDKDKDKEKNPN